MNRYSRRILIGIVAGGIASAVLIYTVSHPLVGVLLGIITGAAYSASMSHTRVAYADNMMTAASLGVPLWALISVVAIPVLADRVLDWSAEQMRTHFPALVGWVLYDALLGLLTQGFSEVADRHRRAAPSGALTKKIVTECARAIFDEHPAFFGHRLAGISF
jgi:hypothetical protein